MHMKMNGKYNVRDEIDGMSYRHQNCLAMPLAFANIIIHIISVNKVHCNLLNVMDAHNYACHCFCSFVILLELSTSYYLHVHV